MQAKSFWFPSCELKGNVYMFYLSLEGINLILISSLCLLWRFSHTLLKLSRAWQGEGCNVMYIPSASLRQLGEAVSGSRRRVWSDQQEAEDRKGDDVAVFQFLLCTAERLSHFMFQVTGVLHAITSLRTWS